MQEPLRIAFRNMEAPAAIEEEIRDHVAELETFFDRITNCSVVVEARHHHHRQGRLFHVSIRLTVPEREIFVQRDPAEDHAHEDLHVTIRDAFAAARRQLQDHAREKRGDVKVHEAPAIGRIVRLFPERGYGFLATDTGDEVYVHRNAVLGRGFDALRVGDRVRYVVKEGEGEQGPQASTVVPL
ncbi:HPF/RaiA family ribosome-associated protein [Limobrevibacterium gyesilva]|uniref:HPF/RaiA family ribosome-associated protein n=1 Tax=Limobrevibacterium gyesilva TaxID=2991712 RepID=A0AA42CFA5_9PROT|nr:HPF/RaiA family ribosome-associated protein [Limobrevibacterium gyesilva]MCW3474586.1 HPF/RaiA family ribosome-associated protein [Limobrevibacterium gyesilva]